ncbi:LPD7 domain-containing protein [Enterobacter hormaechei]
MNRPNTDPDFIPNPFDEDMFSEMTVVDEKPSSAAIETPTDKEEAPDLQRDLLEVESRIASFQDMLSLGERVGLTAEQKTMLTTEIEELKVMYKNLHKTLNPEAAPADEAELLLQVESSSAPAPAPVHVNEADLTDLDMFTINRAKGVPVADQPTPSVVDTGYVDDEIQPEQPKQKKSLAERVRGAKAKALDAQVSGDSTTYKKPGYIQHHENQMPETQMNVKTEGRSRYMSDEQLKSLFGENYRGSKTQRDSSGAMESRTHYFHDSFLIKETEDSVMMRGRRKANDIAIDLIDVVKAKGWTSIRLTSGNPVFMEQAYVNAIKNGLTVEAVDLRQEADFQILHKRYNLESYAPFGGLKEEEMKPKEEALPEYQVSRGRGMRM